MKTKIICLLLALVMLVPVFASCGDETPVVDNTCTSHVDDNADGKCDKCKAKMNTINKCDNHADNNNDGKCDSCGGDMGGEEVVDYPWSNTNIIFQMSLNSDSGGNPSGSKRYLAGEDLGAVELIDSQISQRNSEAYDTTKVRVTYDYLPDTNEYAWGKSIDDIYATVQSQTTKDAPDIYSNFTYDIVGASLKTCFANLRSSAYGANYFEFLDEDYDEATNNRGYMYEFMQSTTLFQQKMYVLASDYFTDLIRAFFIVPVNVKLLEQVGMGVTGDLTGDGKFTIDDFYAEVEAKKWTYDKVASYSDAVYSGSAGAETLNDTIGFAITAGGIAASGLLYTTSITVIDRGEDETGENFNYAYPAADDMTELFDFTEALGDLVNKTGVLVVTDANTEGYGDNALRAIRNQFCANKVLFGDVINLGALEEDKYQTLKESSGFGVVPVPLYHEIPAGSNETYLTSIHNNGRPGAIAANTKNFAQCTAFLNYQSTHSTDILNFYYDYKLQYDVAGGADGTVKMLQYIRLNVRSNFDKVIEDAIGVFNETSSERWHAIILAARYDVEDMRKEYDNRYETKTKQLQDLVKLYGILPA